MGYRMSWSLLAPSLQWNILSVVSISRTDWKPHVPLPLLEGSGQRKTQLVEFPQKVEGGWGCAVSFSNSKGSKHTEIPKFRIVFLLPPYVTAYLINIWCCTHVMSGSQLSTVTRSISQACARPWYLCSAKIICQWWRPSNWLETCCGILNNFFLSLWKSLWLLTGPQVTRKKIQT